MEQSISQRQLRFPIIDAILGDANPSLFDASGGRKSRGRTMLLEILKTKTREEVAREIRCSSEFVSMLSSGQRKPARWRLMDRIVLKFKIPREAWEDTESPLAMSLADEQLQLAEFERYERARLVELHGLVVEHEERLAEILEEKAALLHPTQTEVHNA
jgi:hypothetical protein